MIKVYYIEPVGGQGGMYYYDFAICQALQKQGINITFVTCQETLSRNVPDTLDIQYAFRGIYGKKHVFIRGKNYIISLINILRILRNKRCIIHLHFFPVPFVDCLFIFFMKKKHKIIITAHDVIPFSAKFYTRFIFKKIYKIVDKIIVHAQSNKKEIMQKFGLDTNKIVIIPHGNYLPFLNNNNINQNTAKMHLGIDNSSKVILFFGQIKKAKGLSYLIKAFKRVLKNHPNCILVIAGKVWKDNFSKYSRLISSLKLDKQVITRIEYIPDKEVPYYFHAANVVALPYIKIYQSGVLLMAYSYGKPVVASSVGGLAEVIQDRTTGFLVPPKDEVKLAEAITELLSNKEKAKEMGKKGKRLVEDRFSWESIAKKTKNLYIQLEKGL